MKLFLIGFVVGVIVTVIISLWLIRIAERKAFRDFWGP